MSDRRTDRPRARGMWRAAPSAALRRALVLPPGDPAPAEDHGAIALEPAPRPRHVRSVARYTETEVLAVSHPAMDLALLVDPPGDAGSWTLRGRVWNREAPEKDVLLLVLERDHVLASRWVSSGRSFEIQETMGEGWILEIRVPGQPTLTVRNPLS